MTLGALTFDLNDQIYHPRNEITGPTINRLYAHLTLQLQGIHEMCVLEGIANRAYMPCSPQISASLGFTDLRVSCAFSNFAASAL